MSRVFFLETKISTRRKLRAVLQGFHDDIELKFYRSTIGLLAAINNVEVDVVFISVEDLEIPCAKMVDILLKINSNIKIVLMSKNKEMAYEALRLQLGGFLLKPINNEEITNVLLRLSDNACAFPVQHFAGNTNIRMVTMPKFDMYINGELVRFKRKKGKELMAYLVDADGGVVNPEMVVGALWEGENIGRSQKSRCYVLMNCLQNFLKGLGLGRLLIAQKGQYRLDNSQYTSDLAELLNGDKKIIFHYDHRYMDEYSWAERRKVAIDEFVAKYKI